MYNQQGIPACSSNTVIWVETGGVQYGGGVRALDESVEYVIK